MLMDEPDPEHGDVDPRIIDQSLDLNDGGMEVDDEQQPGGRKKRKGDPSRVPEDHIKIALSLYKVQQNIYLLDFQRVEVNPLAMLLLIVDMLLLCFRVMLSAS